MESRADQHDQAEPEHDPASQVAAVLFVRPGAGDFSALETALRSRGVAIHHAANRYTALIETLCAAGPREDGPDRRPAALIVIDPQDLPHELVRRLDQVLATHRPTAIRRGFDTRGDRRLAPLSNWVVEEATAPAASPAINGAPRASAAPSLRLADAEAHRPEESVATELTEEEIAMLLDGDSPRPRNGTNPGASERRTSSGGDDA